MNVGVISNYKPNGEMKGDPIYYTSYKPAPEFLDWLKREVESGYNNRYTITWQGVGYLKEQAEIVFPGEIKTVTDEFLKYKLRACVEIHTAMFLEPNDPKPRIEFNGKDSWCFGRDFFIMSALFNETGYADWKIITTSSDVGFPDGEIIANCYAYRRVTRLGGYITQVDIIPPFKLRYNCYSYQSVFDATNKVDPSVQEVMINPEEKVTPTDVDVWIANYLRKDSKLNEIAKNSWVAITKKPLSL